MIGCIALPSGWRTAGTTTSARRPRSRGTTGIRPWRWRWCGLPAWSTASKGRAKAIATSALAKFLLDNRRDGSEYDQSHVPVTQQYEAVGHAVRAVYSYAAMTDIATATRDVDYLSAVMSLWNNLVNAKYYVTGGVGSGETSEGFGPDYSLGHNAYCESCSSCGEIFFQHRLNLLQHDAQYVDLYEQTLYNALLGSMDLEGKNFYYQNPLDEGQPPLRLARLSVLRRQHPAHAAGAADLDVRARTSEGST